MDLHYGAGVCVVTDLASVLPCSFGQSFIYFFLKGWSVPTKPGPV